MILWIDDDINGALNPFVDELQENGYHVVNARNPDDVWEHFIKSNIYGIIMDIMLPTGTGISLEESKMGVLTGLLLLKKIKSNAKLSKIPILIFTILSDQELSTWAKDNNITILKKQDTLPKELVEKIKALCIKKDGHEK